MTSDDAAGAEEAPRDERSDEQAPSELTSTLSLGSAEVEPEVASPDPDQAAVGALPKGSALRVRQSLAVHAFQAVHHADMARFRQECPVVRESPDRQQRVQAAGFTVDLNFPIKYGPESTGA